eukprot:scaffold279_cov229-Pinguiococcus_pyrenoidosus.AAC.17
MSTASLPAKPPPADPCRAAEAEARQRDLQHEDAIVSLLAALKHPSSHRFDGFGSAAVHPDLDPVFPPASSDLRRKAPRKPASQQTSAQGSSSSCSQQDADRRIFGLDDRCWEQSSELPEKIAKVDPTLAELVRAPLFVDVYSQLVQAAGSSGKVGGEVGDTASSKGITWPEVEDSVPFPVFAAEEDVGAKEFWDPDSALNTRCRDDSNFWMRLQANLVASGRREGPAEALHRLDGTALASRTSDDDFEDLVDTFELSAPHSPLEVVLFLAETMPLASTVTIREQNCYLQLHRRWQRVLPRLLEWLPSGLSRKTRSESFSPCEEAVVTLPEGTQLGSSVCEVVPFDIGVREMRNATRVAVLEVELLSDAVVDETRGYIVIGRLEPIPLWASYHVVIDLIDSKRPLPPRGHEAISRALGAEGLV